jgi:hypothetical protein
MFRLLLFLHHFALAPLMHCIVLFLAHIYSYVLDHVELELEVQVKQAQVKASTNLNLDQGKARCI